MRFEALAIGFIAGGCDYVLRLDDIHPPPPPPPDMVCDPTTHSCIDRTEVTRTSYGDFVAANPTELNHPSCAGNTFTPYGSWPPPPGDNQPVVEIDWCDAYAYCAWAGKRLCGAIGGGPLSPADRSNVAKDQWYAACTGGVDANTYPYGPTYTSGLCNDSQPSGAVHDVTDDAGCAGGLPGLLDMSGNVWELVDTCTSLAPDADCDVRGGAFNESPTTVTCASYTGLSHPRNSWHQGIIGFRCCSDP